MTHFVETIAGQLQASVLLELVAVLLAILYLLLAVRQQIACWYAAFVSTAIFLYIFWQVNLYMESALQVYYLAMAVYGWWHWRGRDGSVHSHLPVSTWPWKWHLWVIVGVATATLISGTLLSNTDQRLAYIDSFTTWASVITTFMVARKILENWLYWLVIDSVSILLYLDRELYLTAFLFTVYIVIICFGWFAWYRHYKWRKMADE